MIWWTYERFCQNKNFLDAYITKFYGTPLSARTPLTLISPKYKDTQRTRSPSSRRFVQVKRNGQFPFSFLFFYKELSHLQHQFMPNGMTSSYTE